jgi:hypothetical protein
MHFFSIKSAINFYYILSIIKFTHIQLVKHKLMKAKLPMFLLLWSIVMALPAQKPIKGDTIKIEGESIEIRIPAKKIPVQDIQKPVEEVKQVETAIQKELKDYTLEMQDQKFISDNVVTQVNVEKVDKNLKVVYSYSLINDTLKYQTDDFGLGKYRVDASNAMQVTLQVMKRNVEGQLAKYISPEREISIIINGSADATPIRGIIPYNGEYGNSISENCTIEGKVEKTVVSATTGISSNSVLAFIRSVAVKDYIENNILKPPFTKVSYGHSATVSSERGGQYRRVSIEMTVYNAFENQ